MLSVHECEAKTADGAVGIESAPQVILQFAQWVLSDDFQNAIQTHGLIGTRSLPRKFVSWRSLWAQVHYFA